MVNLMGKAADVLLGRKSQTWLFLGLLIAGGVARFTLFAGDKITLDRVGFVAHTSQEQGQVVYSCTACDLLLLVTQGNLHWKSGEESFIIAENVVNLYSGQESLLVKTRAAIGEVRPDTGDYEELVRTESIDYPGFLFSEARLVGVSGQRFYLSYQDLVLGVETDGVVEGPYSFDGRRNPKLVESDWRSGAAFVRDNSWTVYVNFRQDETAHIEQNLGVLQDVIMSAAASEVIYALQAGTESQVLHAKVDGSEAEIIYREEIKFSSLEAVWSPDSRLVAVSILGYQEDAGYDDTFICTTFLYQPGRSGTAVLSRNLGPEVRALVPTAWDSQKPLLWFYWLHQETPAPVYYSFFNQ